jgi:hypothetical protein
MSKRYALSVQDENGQYVPVGVFFGAEGAVAADYLSFIQYVLGVLLEDVDDLEREANASGRTIKHGQFGAFGSQPLDRE